MASASSTLGEHNLHRGLPRAHSFVTALAHGIKGANRARKWLGLAVQPAVRAVAAG